MRCYRCMRELKQKAKFCPYCGKKTLKSNPLHQLKAGTVLHHKYLIGNAIGEGGFGITYVGFDQTLDLKVAVKEYFPSGCANRNNAMSNDVTLNYTGKNDYFIHGKESFLREAKSIAKFSQERGIVNVRDYFTENNTAYIVMEFLDGVDLGSYVRAHGAFEPNALFRLLLPLMRSLQKMHAAGVIHRDISPENIMFVNGESLTLTDFGAARYFSTEEKSKSLSVVLKPGYAPYEQYTRKGRQGPWTDVYALCATAYYCITGVTPPDSLGRNFEDDLKKPSELGVNITPRLESVLLSGLRLRRQERLQNMDELIAAAKAALSAEGDSEPIPHPAEPPLTLEEENLTRVADDTAALTRFQIQGSIPTYGESDLYRSEPTEPRHAKKRRGGKKLTLLIMVFSIILLVLGAIAISVAVSQRKAAAPKSGALKDDALVFTAAQSTELRQKLDEASRETDWQLIIHTSKDGVTADNAAEHYNNYYADRDFADDAIMLAIDNTSGEHVILSYGTAMRYFQNGSENYQTLISAVKPYLDNGEIYEASKVFIDRVVAIHQAGEPTTAESSVQSVPTAV